VARPVIHLEWITRLGRKGRKSASFSQAKKSDNGEF
jgi:hypothetical protein